MSEFEAQLDDVLEQVEERNKRERREATVYGAMLNDDDEEGDD